MHAIGRERYFGWAGAVLLFLAAGLLWAGTARAEPYLAVREGYKCSKCHVNKTGGGMRTDFALVYMQTRGAMWSGVAHEAPAAPAEGQAAGEATTLQDYPNGHLGDYFSVGADLRAGYYSRTPTRSNVQERFSREAACEGCHTGANGGGKRGELFYKADLMPERAFVYGGMNLLPRVDTREFFALLEGLPLNGYVKAGTFRLPTAFNRYYDDPFAHGQTSGNTQYLSPRGEGVELGIEAGPLAVSLSVTNAGFPEAPQETSAKRNAALGYVVFRHFTAGASYVVDHTSAEDERRITGAFAGVSVGRFTALVERDQIDDQAAKTDPELGTAELNFLITKGQNVKLVYEYYDPDRDTDGDLADRTSFIYEPFVWPYIQFRAGYREAIGPVDDPVSNYKKYFLELHAIY